MRASEFTAHHMTARATSGQRLDIARNSSRSTALFGRSLYGSEEPLLITSALVLLNLQQHYFEALVSDDSRLLVV